MSRPIQSQSGQSGLQSEPPAHSPELVAALANWTTGRGPMYRRLADALRLAIGRGDLGAGARLPPERQLAQQLSVSRSTIVAAYELLREHELLERRQGSGTRVRPSPREARGARERAEGVSRSLGRNLLFRRITEGLVETVDLVGAYLLGAGGLPPSALVGLDREIANLSLGPGYMPLGLPALRRAIADHLDRTGLPTVPEQVVVTTGAQQAIQLAAWLYLQPGDTAVVENPTYPGALDAFSTVGARLAWVPTGRQGVDSDQLAEVVARAAPRVVYLIPTYQNPVGGVLSENRRRAVARLVEEHRLPLIEDDSLAGLSLGPEPPPCIASYAPETPICTIGSLSKLGWGGLRVGWIRAPEPAVVQLGRLKAVADLGGSLPSQIIAVRLLEQWDELRRSRGEVLGERLELMGALLGRLLPSWSWERPQGGLCLWVRLPHGNATEFAQVALRHGVSVVAGPIASADGSFGDYLRLPFGHEPATLEEGVRRLAQAWQAYVPQREPARQNVAVIV